MRRRGIGLATVASARPPLRRRRDAGTGNPSPSPASVQTVRPAAPPEINDGPHRRSVVRGPTRIEPFTRPSSRPGFVTGTAWARARSKRMVGRTTIYVVNGRRQSWLHIHGHVEQ